MDNIARINGQEAMAYQGATPWHMLGSKMPPKVRVEAALKAANLDWNVDLQPVYFVSHEDFIPIKNKRAVVRDVDDQVLGVVSDTYAPLQNHEAFGVLNTACEQHGVTIETAGALGRGERVWMQAKLPDSIEPVPGDRIDGYFLLMTGHNGGIPFTARPTPLRVVCENTISVALSKTEALITLRHMQSEVELIKIVEELIAKLVHALQVSGDCFSKLAAKKWNLVQVKDYINAVLGIAESSSVESFITQYLEVDTSESARTKQRDTILNLVWRGKGSELAGATKKGATAWAAYNAVTEYVDHVRPARLETEKAIRMANKSALFGFGANLKDRALQLAIAA